MRLGLIARGCRPGSGIELYTWELARRLAQRHEVSVLALPGRFAECGARFLPVAAPAFPLWFSIGAFSVRAGVMARRLGLEVVHAQGSDSTWGDVVTAHACHAAGMRASLRHDPAWANRCRKILSPAHRIITSLEKKVYAQARVILPVSRQVRRELCEFYPHLESGRLQVLPLGVDQAQYSPQARLKARGAARAKLGLRPGQVAMVLAANQPRLKGAERLLSAMSRLADPRLVFIIATSAPRAAALKRQIRQLKLEASVRWHSSGRDAFPAYAAADFYAALPEYEAFGLSMLEAMACALPLLATRNAGLAEWLSSGQEGILLPEFADAETVAAGMRRMLDPRLRQSWGRRARVKARDFSWDQMARSLEKIYAGLARGQRRSGAGR